MILIMQRFFMSIIMALFLLPLMSCALLQQKNNEGIIDSDDMVLVPSGWFYMGSNEGEFNESPEHEVFVETFRLDSQELAARDFSEFLNDKGNPDSRYFSCDKSSTIICVSREGKETDGSGEDIVRYLPRPGHENYPANNVSWYGADAFCQWKGKRLPGEAEWEKAARGDDRRVYPWGNRIPDDLVSRFDKKSDNKGLNVLLPVDSLADFQSYYRLYNMAGNVLEWTGDWYRQNYCNFCDPGGGDYIAAASEIVGLLASTVTNGSNYPDISSKYNSAGPPVGSFRTLRGGSWYDYNNNELRSSYRSWLDPAERYPYTGFRCAK